MSFTCKFGLHSKTYKERFPSLQGFPFICSKCKKANYLGLLDRIYFIAHVARIIVVHRHVVLKTVAFDRTLARRELSACGSADEQRDLVIKSYSYVEQVLHQSFPQEHIAIASKWLSELQPTIRAIGFISLVK
jgi:hypothetical protein